MTELAQRMAELRVIEAALVWAEARRTWLEVARNPGYRDVFHAH